MPKGYYSFDDGWLYDRHDFAGGVTTGPWEAGR